MENSELSCHLFGSNSLGFRTLQGLLWFKYKTPIYKSPSFSHSRGEKALPAEIFHVPVVGWTQTPICDRTIPKNWKILSFPKSPHLSLRMERAGIFSPRLQILSLKKIPKAPRLRPPFIQDWLKADQVWEWKSGILQGLETDPCFPEII